MFAKTDKKHASHTEALIATGTVVAGDILFSGGLRIDGEVIGDVRARDGQPGTLVIGEKGRVHGNIEVTHLVINGLVTGRIEAKECIRLQSKARVNCDVEYAAAEIHPGAVIQGRLLQRQAGARIDASQEGAGLLRPERTSVAL